LNPTLHAIVILWEKEALQEVAACDTEFKQGRLRGPLHGIPMTIKEQFWLKNTPSTLNNQRLKDWVAPEDAVVVARLKKAGAIILGKSNLSKDLLDYQIDGDIYPTCVNPYNQAYSPGGSSGGAAVALATGMVPIELGGDLGGSLRIPPNFCGVYGLKTTEKTIPSHGLTPKPKEARGHLHDLAVPGPMARTVEDLELVWNIIKGPDKKERTVPPIEWEKPLHKNLEDYTIAWVNGWPGYETSPSTQRLIKEFMQLIQEKGAKVIQFNPPTDLHQKTIDLHKRISLMMIMQDIPRWVKPLMMRGLKQGFLKGMENIVWKFRDTFLGYSEIMGQRAEIVETWESHFENFDLLICPAGFGPSFPRCKIGSPITYEGKTIKYIDYVYPYHACFNASGHPAMCIPLGLGKEELPVGVQVVGPYWSEPDIIHFAKLIAKDTKGFVPPKGF
jgi:amidase